MKNLANQLRPNTINEIVGQEHIKSLFRQVVKNNLTTSFLLFGESGVGKSSSAIALAKELNKKYGYFNAAVDSKKQLSQLLDTCQILIVDEIHRLNKDKQDILLPYLEFDKIIIYATTTENPYFKVNPALRSRMQILQFYKLSNEQIIQGLRNIINQHFPELNISNELLAKLAFMSSGDYRIALNNLQMLGILKSNSTPVSEADLKLIIPNIQFYSDAKGSAHYNNLSALHKSLRGSDVDASIYYGMLIATSGDFDGLFRRMLAVTYEDIGLASSSIQFKVHNAINAYERLGVPEGLLPITYALIELALAPKSNSVVQARDMALNLINSGHIYTIPKHLRDAHYASASKLGDGIGYAYPHDFRNNWVKQQYLPNELINQHFYTPGLNQREQAISKYWTELKNKE
ncbi:MULTISPECIES: replication-associated recombination protein A [unclassified Mycoplasma]|uniref:replication-associated recombination protein A n=1 Tax=unclassified Mycoplasma TaxID=2683645 RepID=UPI00211C133E|nr:MULTISPECIES: replication-associated recombination protein A [unclassified Mycoplasma]UUM19610.1 replication-associated recombination protein A [Mycoplasma sp. 1578d]UUM24580.1 replication-associated recombination protein A [Mycoplasma sp. 3686d]